MSINVLLLEDDPLQLNMLESMLNEAYLNIKITSCTQIDGVINNILKEVYDVILLDIEIGKQNSIDSLDEIVGDNPQLGRKIIYISAYNGYALKAINLIHCFGFLEKPYTKYELTDVINNCISNQRKFDRKSSFLTYYVNGETHSINKDDILFIEYQNKKPIIHTKHNKYILSRTVINELLYKLNNTGTHRFIRCRRSNIINLTYLSAISKDDSGYYAVMQNSEIIPIGNRYKEELLKEILDKE